MQDCAALLPSVSAHDEGLRGFNVERLLARSEPSSLISAPWRSLRAAGKTSRSDVFGPVLAAGAVAAEERPKRLRSKMGGYAVASGSCAISQA
jgi:hypothetical protein